MLVRVTETPARHRIFQGSVAYPRIEHEKVSALPWSLNDADKRGVAYLSLPITTDSARLLLRGQRFRSLPQALVTKKGRFADVMSLGFPTLYAVSPRFSTAIQGLAGVVVAPIEIQNGPDGYGVLGAIGRCGAVDYGRSTQVKRMGDFILVRGLYVDEPREEVDFAVPTNREELLISQRAADVITGARLENVRIVSVKEEEFHINEGDLGPPT